jgi:hypothetical protein
MASSVEKKDELTGKVEDMDRYVHKAYQDQINWYWKASSDNKKTYKTYRLWTVILGALVTLIASLSTTRLISDNELAGNLFTILTAILAAVLTIINTLSQNFQWGATWRDMVINASRLIREKDRFLATDQKERDHKQELITINNIVLEETQAFFRRILDTEAVPIESPNDETTSGSG